MPHLLVRIALVASIGLCACQEETVCTTEFRAVVVRVLGDSLTDYYTVRVTNSDTIRYVDSRLEGSTGYVVLDDSYQSALANKQEQFRFVGEINNVVVVDEEYVVKADECHISKVSGKDEVRL